MQLQGLQTERERPIVVGYVPHETILSSTSSFVFIVSFVVFLQVSPRSARSPASDRLPRSRSHVYSLRSDVLR
jgi:hypothetical protein